MRLKLVKQDQLKLESYDSPGKICFEMAKVWGQAINWYMTSLGCKCCEKKS